MRSVFVSLPLSVALASAAVPVAAQDAGSEPSPLPVLCLRVTVDTVPEVVDALTLGQLLIAGEASLEVLETGACQATGTAAEPEPEPGAEATPGPTPEPTARPTQEPTPERAAQPPTRGQLPAGRASRAYAEFVAHGAGAAVELAALAEAYRAVEGLPALDQAAADLGRWARRQVRWLDRHPPAACYADVHRQWRRGAVRIRDGTGALRTAIKLLRPEPVRRAVRQLSDGVRNLAGVDLDAATRACLEAG